MEPVCQVWWLRPIIPVPGWLRQEHRGTFKSSLSYTVGSRQAEAMVCEILFQSKEREEGERTIEDIKCLLPRHSVTTNSECAIAA